MFEKLIKILCAGMFYKDKFNLQDSIGEFKKAQDKLIIGIKEMEQDIDSANDRIEDAEIDRDEAIAEAYNECSAKVKVEEEYISNLEDDISEAREWLNIFPSKK